MRALAISAIALILAAQPTMAQQLPRYPSGAVAAPPSVAPMEKDLWEAMVNAVSNVPMSLPAHQQVQRIFADVMREAEARTSRLPPPSRPEEGKPKAEEIKPPSGQ